MRIGFAMLAGTAALSLALGAGSAVAVTRHHHRHATTSPQTTQAPQLTVADTSLNGNNPAKRYPTRHMSDGAMKTSTLYQSGNNPAKQYGVRHAPANANPQLTMTGNNPAKNYPVTASR